MLLVLLLGRWYPKSHTTLGPLQTWDQKLKSASRAFTLGVKAAIEKKLFNLPQVTKKC
jgi:hypothetical protein